MKTQHLITSISILSILFFAILPSIQAQEIDIPEPVPPPTAVREAFDLDPFYQQWVDVNGFPVVASAKVNPYAVKEAAYLVYQMLKHRPDILEALVEARARLAVMAITEHLTDIPENRDWPVPYFHAVRGRAIGGSKLVVNEETMLNYPGQPYEGHNSVFHEFGHTVDYPGLRRVDPEFDERLRQAYESAVKQRSWKGSYTAVNEGEYWAEGSESWFYPTGKTNEHRYGNTREALKARDPELAALLIEVYGDDEWRYTPPETRLHEPHLHGFDPQNTPTFQYPPEAVALYEELLWNPESTGDGRWINLEPYPLSELPRLQASRKQGERTEIIIGNFTGNNVLLVYSIAPDGTEYLRYRLRGDMVPFNTHVGELWLIKDSDGNNLSVYRAEAKTGRILFLSERCDPKINDVEDVVDTSTTWKPGPKIEGPWLWMIASTSGYSGSEAACLEEDWLAKASSGSVTEKQIAINGAIEGASVGNRVWTFSKIVSTSGNNITELVTAIGLAKDDNVHHLVAYGSIALDAPQEQNTKMYIGSDDAVKVWLNGTLVHNNPVDRGAYDYQERFPITLKQGKNILLVAVYNGAWNWSGFFGFEKDAAYNIMPPSNIEPDIEISDPPADGQRQTAEVPPMYWVDTQNRTLHRLVDTEVEKLVPSVKNATSLAIDVVSEKLYWTEKTGQTTGRIQRANLDGTNIQLVKNLTSVPYSIAIDTENRKVYITNAWGKVQSLNFDGSKFQSNLITGLKTPENITVNAANRKIYWTEKTSERTGTIKSANLNGSNVQRLKNLTSLPKGMAVDTVNAKLYLINASSKIQRLNLDGSNFEANLITNLDKPADIAVDTANGKIYWAEKARIRRANLDTTNIQDIVTGIGTPASIVLGVSKTIDDSETMGSPSADINEDGKINVTDLLLVVIALQGREPVNPRTDVNADGTVTIADLLFVIQNLDDPVSAAAPGQAQTITSLDQTMLEAQLRFLIAESDGSLKYQQAIAFLQTLLMTTPPDKTRLFANYPNPFNPETWIPYQLAKAAEVTVSIYSIDGKLVRRLALGYLPAGIYQRQNRAAYWDGKNEVGETVASGVYFYSLKAGDFTATRKMLIRK